MIIILILLTVLLICIGIFISSFFCISTETKYYYDKSGKEETYGSRIENYKELNLDKDKKYPCRIKYIKKIETERYWGLDEVKAGWSFGIGLATLIPTLITGIWCIVVHGPVNQVSYQTKLEVRVDDLIDRQNSLYLTLSGDLNLQVTTDGTSSYHIVVDKPVDILDKINEYNSDVKQLKQELYLEKIRSESPWTNWFINPGYTKIEGYNPNATSYKDILSDKLKTFELKTV